jgi:hypothetical protein
MSPTQRILLLGFSAILLLNALIKMVLIWFSLKLPLEISKLGMTVRGVKMGWEAIDACRWAPYSPDTLEVRTHLIRDYLPIPRSYRAGVEAALRKVGKWRR